MLNLHDKFLDNVPDNFHGQDLPLFKDVYKVFQLLTDNIRGLFCWILWIPFNLSEINSRNSKFAANSSSS